MPAKVLPSAPEAEAGLLGTMLVYSGATRTAIETGLCETDFFIDINRRIFAVISSLYHEGTPVDLATVSTRLKDTNQLDLVGGFQYLTDLTNASVTSANTKKYVEIVKDKAVVRKLIEVAEEIAQSGLDGQPDLDIYLDQAEKKILDISRDRRTTAFKGTPELMSTIMDNIRRMSENHSNVTGVPTGLRDLDHHTHGLQKGDLIIVAARPAMGKTAVSLNLALNVALSQQETADAGVAVFSLEMSAEQLAMRLLSAKSRVPGDNLKTGFMSNEDWNRANEAAFNLKKIKLFIDDTPAIKVSEIFAKCRRLQAEHGLSLVLIDYIQLIQGSGSRGENRQQEVSEISRSLKGLARELKVPVIALSQLSRSVEQREDKHPMLSDLRESGAIEQDADIVMMLYREAYYNEEKRQIAQANGVEPLEINIVKHRNGATGRVEVAFENKTNALMNYTKQSAS